MKKYDKPLWSYSLDTITPDNVKIIYRSLLNATSEFAYNKDDFFVPQDVFIYHKDLYFGSAKAESVKKVLLYLIAHNLWQEGFLGSNSLLLSYPSHKAFSPDTTFSSLASFGSYLPEVLTRWRTTENKSYFRSRGWYSKVTFESEFNSLLLQQQKLVSNKIAIVLDDFATTGLSLEASRNLLFAAEVEAVVLCTIGKFTKVLSPKHRIYKINTPFNPMKQEDKILKGNYSYNTTPLTTHYQVQEELQDYFLNISSQ